MCRFISFFHKPDADGKPELVIWDLTSHGNTEKELQLNTKLWAEGHYTPDTGIELRYLDSFRQDKTEYESCLKSRFPDFKSFLNYSLAHYGGGWLGVRGCDLKDVKLPESIGGWLDVRGCDLKDVKLPKSIGGWLDVSGCDLKDVKLPESIGCSLYVRGCDLKDVLIPEKYKNKLIY